MTKRRGLSPKFMGSLQTHAGLGLNRIVQAVKHDHTLDFEIRENYFNIYYRGGSLMRLEEKHGNYTAFFDRNYILNPETTRLSALIARETFIEDTDLSHWLDALPFLKQEMDYWFTAHTKDEREFQQLIVRENNFGNPAKSTDYFVCDIEYSNEVGRFDLIAVHWPSSGEKRKKNQNLDLAILEMKYLNKSMARTAGIYEHILDISHYFELDVDHFAGLKEEMRTVFNQKLELGLIDNVKPIESFSDKLPEYILLLANHDPDSRILIRELERLKAIAGDLPFTIKFAVSNFMGYGLYYQNIFTLEEFLTRFEKQIYAR